MVRVELVERGEAGTPGAVVEEQEKVWVQNWDGEVKREKSMK